MNMSKTLRRLLLPLLPAAAAAALVSTQALPAHAASAFNLRTAWDSGQCLQPDSYYGLGTSVHEYGCGSPEWEIADVEDGAYRFVWLPSGGCLIPNWNQKASPVVVTNGTNVCNNSNSQWRLNNLSDGHLQFVNVATGLVLDYDISGANRGLQLWPPLHDSNQDFYTTS